MVSDRAKFLFDTVLVQIFSLKPDNWSNRNHSVKPCVSKYVSKIFNLVFPFVDLVTFTGENFENLPIATKKYIFFPL